MSWKTIRFDEQINFSTFLCDEPILNDYLHTRAVEEHKNDICTLYFLINDMTEVGGYFVLSNGSIRRQQLPNAKERQNLPGYPLGTIHIGRLARNKDIINQKLGNLLIHSAIEISVESTNKSAAHAITVDAKNERAEKYYTKYGFKNLKLPDEQTNKFPKAMYMKIKDARFILGTT